MSPTSLNQLTPIRTVPVVVEQLEKILLDAICDFLAARHKQLTKSHCAFLCSPWVHFFTHSILHQLDNHRIDIAHQKMLPMREVHEHQKIDAPGDTLAFMEFFRTRKYCQYIDQAIVGKAIAFEARTATQILPLKPNHWATTTAFMTCFPRNFRYLMGWLNFGRIQFLDNKFELIDVALISEYRLEMFYCIKNSLQNFPESSSSWISERVIECFPKSLLENLAFNLAQKSQLPANKNLYSADGWHIIDDWKIFALSQKINHQTHWIGAPNAISHGSLALFWQRDFELTHMDTYLTWGWYFKQGGKSNLIDFFAPHHAGKKQQAFSGGKKRCGILISSAARPKHLLEQPYTPDRFEFYLKNQLALAKKLNKIFNDSITIRTRPKDLGWDVKALVDGLENPNIQLEFQSGRFSDRLKLSQLHICDNCSTTIVESFWANHPTLVVITDDYFQLHPEALNDYSLLAEAGIFHTTLESLFKHCESIRDQPEKWWMHPQTQKAVKNFLTKQGRLGGGLREWTRALISSPNELRD